jgi:hypothetical protein
LNIHLQALVGEVSLFNGVIEKGVQGVGVPVQHHVDLPQAVPGGSGGGGCGGTGGASTAGEQQQAGQGEGGNSFHQSRFLSFAIIEITGFHASG